MPIKGHRMSDETKQKMALAHKGKTHTKETCAMLSKMSAGDNNWMRGRCGELHPRFGTRHTPETIEKLSGKNNPMFGMTGEKHPRFGKHPTPETLQKMSDAAKGKHPSEETREKLSRAGRGRKNPHSEEHKAKISATMRGRTLPEETRAKVSASLMGHKGVKHTEESKQKMRLAALAANRCGARNPNWRGGQSFEPYCPKWNTNLRDRIRAFFDDRCVLCGNPGSVQKRKLSCHHVEYNKAACCDGKPVHFAALCGICHNKTNTDRDRWEAMIHRIIDEIYEGRSYYTKDEWADMCSSAAEAAI